MIVWSLQTSPLLLPTRLRRKGPTEDTRCISSRCTITGSWEYLVLAGKRPFLLTTIWLHASNCELKRQVIASNEYQIHECGYPKAACAGRKMAGGMPSGSVALMLGCAKTKNVAPMDINHQAPVFAAAGVNILGPLDVVCLCKRRLMNGVNGTRESYDTWPSLTGRQARHH